MNLPSLSYLPLILNLVALLVTPEGVSGASFTFVNRCDYTVWPAIFARNASSPSPRLNSTGFELPKDSSRSFEAPTGWSGRFWGRTGCKFDGSGSGTCQTGDCGSGQMECNGSAPALPVTLAEFTLATRPDGIDFYDVSLVDGYNLPLILEGTAWSGLCASAGCTTDMNRQCPSELRVGDGYGCKGACDAFRSEEYCCFGAYGTAATCRPTVYSKMFKAACPTAYTYPYDDATGRFTCTGANYTVTFCPYTANIAQNPNSVAPSPDPSLNPKGRQDMKGLLVGVIVGACCLIFGLGFTWFILRRKRQKDRKLDDNISDVFFGLEFHNGIGFKKFSLVELAKVTNNFKDELKLGEGGFGAVYRGYLGDLDTYIAVKRVSKASKQGIKEYASEVKIISRLRHRNLVKLIGWCHEKGELILVYEFMANGSLDSHLFKGKSLLTWEVRFKIVQDLASALLYLHEEGDHCVIHRDIKSSNIMLDSSFNAKLGDFGLARLVDHAKGSQTTLSAGTLGYMAPEYVSSGKASKESDIYSFGVVVLEIACGRRSRDPDYEGSQAELAAWVWDLYGKKRLLDVADQKLCLDFDTKQMECILMIGLWCVHPDHNSRPSIRQVIQVLNFEAPLPDLPGTRPTPTYGLPTSFRVTASEPYFSTLTITLPR